MADLIITPKTKIGELLESYPQLEQTLISYVPAFEKLKNPVLRRTVGRVTTLQQAAAVGGVPVENLINRLRQEVGQDLASAASAAGYNTVRPGWFTEDRVGPGLDATAMLAAGEHPVGQVIADLNALPTGQIYRLVAPFLTAPLIDKAASLGFGHWVTRHDDGSYVIYFGRPKDA
jgi:hypothetical protein